MGNKRNKRLHKFFSKKNNKEKAPTWLSFLKGGLGCHQLHRTHNVFMIASMPNNVIFGALIHNL